MQNTIINYYVKKINITIWHLMFSKKGSNSPYKIYISRIANTSGILIDKMLLVFNCYLQSMHLLDNSKRSVTTGKLY